MFWSVEWLLQNVQTFHQRLTQANPETGLQWLIQPVLTFFPFPWSPSEQAINILDTYLQRCYVKSSEKEMHFIYLLAAPGHSESMELSVLSLTTECGSFLCHQLGISFFAFHVGTTARKTYLNSLQWQTIAYLESFPFVTLIYYFRFTYKSIFPALTCWIKTWNGLWGWLQLSKLQRPVSCMTLWSDWSSLCSLRWVHASVGKRTQCASFSSPVFILF